ncbi:MAG: hypothetical protein AB7I30_10060 [Isosphaeraceae bacterium]
MPSNRRFEMNRRTFTLGPLAAAAAAHSGFLPSAAAAGVSAPAAEPIALGDRRELFLDDLLIDRLEGTAERRLHHPIPRELALTHDAPWEGTGSGYHSVFQDGPLYRMYYKAWHLDVSSGKLRTNAHPLFCCYAESDDGIHWRKPNLGLVEFQGSKANNIVIASGSLGGAEVDAGHPAVFKDENPDAPETARYKAILRSASPNGLIPLGSPDGLRWSALSDRPVITNGVFDSQNLAFWDPTHGTYRAYWRFFTRARPGAPALRAIRTATSPDFLHWSESTDLTYEDSPDEELYTNQVKPYARAPHLLVGFPTRYVDRGWSDSMRALPEREHREARDAAGKRYGTAITEALVMSSRDGLRFQRWNEAFLRPGIEREGAWNYGHQYVAWHLVETRSALPGAPDELSLYAGESYWTGTSSALRRYTLRPDGFVSLSASRAGGALTTPPITFQGKTLRLNFSSAVSGGVRVAILDPAGEPIPGFSQAEGDEIFGDALDRPVTWTQGANLGELAGRPVRLRFTLRDADLYAFRFSS